MAKKKYIRLDGTAHDRNGVARYLSAPENLTTAGLVATALGYACISDMSQAFNYAAAGVIGGMSAYIFKSALAHFWKLAFSFGTNFFQDENKRAPLRHLRMDKSPEKPDISLKNKFNSMAKFSFGASAVALTALTGLGAAEAYAIYHGDLTQYTLAVPFVGDIELPQEIGNTIGLEPNYNSMLIGLMSFNIISALYEITSMYRFGQVMWGDWEITDKIGQYQAPKTQPGVNP
jgi:hypothetical protein